MNLSKFTFWRLIAIFSSISISGCFFLAYFTISNPTDKLFYTYLLIPLAIFMIISVIHQMRFPLDLRIYIVWVFIFSCLGVAYGYTAESMMIFYCGYILGVQVRFFTKEKKYKFAIIIPLYLLSAICQIRLSKPELIRSLVEFCVSISALFSMIFINVYIMKKVKIDILQEVTKANIEDYFKQEKFTERDKQMLNEVLAGCKYEEIALNHKLSISSVKKRLAFLYKKLGVSCQIDFLVKFAGKTENSTKV